MGLLSALSIDSSHLLNTSTPLLLFYTFIIYNLLRFTYTTIYNLYLHPLSSFPGPKVWLILPILRQIDSIRGIREHRTLAYHNHYGDVVRSGPNLLTFTHPDAWRDIYGHHGLSELPKANTRQQELGAPVVNIIDADRKTHARYRRAMAPAFSERALGEMEGLVRGYVDLLMGGLGKVADLQDGDGKGEGVTDIVKWFNFTTFDLIGDLAFGEDLGGLESHTLGKDGEASGTNAWISRIKIAIRVLPWALLIQEYMPGLRFLQRYTPAGPLLQRYIRRAGDEHRAMVNNLVRKRIRNSEYGQARGDFMGIMMRNKGTDADLTDEEHAANADIMMIAGSETTATLLSGVIYLLLKNPEKMDRVKKEVRGAFARKEEITFTTAAMRLPYTFACLQEALRVYPPVPIVMLRETLPGQGTVIAGRVVPGKTRVGVPQLAAFHSERNFHRATEFLPERWLPEATQQSADAKAAPSPFANDRREIHRPFSVGPRDCIGRNLAYHEMRLILSRLLFEFDLTLQKESEGWAERQEVRVFWDKGPLMVGIKRREGMD